MPLCVQAYLWQSQVLELLGRHEDAISRARHAKQLNPLSLAAGLNLGWQMYQAGNYIEASAELDKLIEFNPNFWGGHWAKGHIHNQHRSFRNAITEFQQAVALGGGHSLPMSDSTLNSLPRCPINGVHFFGIYSSVKTANQERSDL